jgi:hypothetical protein
VNRLPDTYAPSWGTGFSTRRSSRYGDPLCIVQAQYVYFSLEKIWGRKLSGTVIAGHLSLADT